MMLEIKDITFAYTDAVIENISCTIESGQNIALIGEWLRKATCSSLFMDYDLNSGYNVQ
jgi:ABC-type phosphate/phosphonate transport system ATPase subunit